MPANTHSALLNASGERLAAGDSASLSVTGNLTIACWINLTSYAAATIAFAVSKIDFNEAGSNRAYAFGLNDNGNNTLAVAIGDGTTFTRKSVAWTPSTGVWYHIAVVYTAAAGTADFYIDAVAQTQQTGLPTSIKDTTESCYVGNSKDGANYPYPLNGYIDDVRIWSRALTGTEISNLKTTPCTFSNGSNLVAQWLLNNNGTDDSGNNNTLTMTNGTFETTVAYACASGTVKRNTLCLLGVS